MYDIILDLKWTDIESLEFVMGLSAFTRRKTGYISFILPLIESNTLRFSRMKYNCILLVLSEGMLEEKKMS